jgi:hypothetical protein
VKADNIDAAKCGEMILIKKNMHIDSIRLDMQQKVGRG